MGEPLFCCGRCALGRGNLHSIVLKSKIKSIYCMFCGEILYFCKMKARPCHELSDRSVLNENLNSFLWILARDFSNEQLV